MTTTEPTVTPVSPAIGVEVTGLHGSELVDPAEAQRCLDLLELHGVVVYRGADIADADLVAFTQLLGEVVVAPMGGLPDHPEVSPVSLDPAKSVLADFRKSTFFWHIDGATDAVPQKASLLAAREVAEDGGDTEFANTYAAYAALGPDEKGALEGVRVRHSFAAAQLLTHPRPDARELAAWRRGPAREQPLVWTRPSGRRSLLLGATTESVVSKSEEEGRAFLDDLLEWSTQPQFVLRHQWRVDDLVVWDNTGMLHRAMPYEPTSRRLLHRTTLVGETAVA